MSDYITLPEVRQILEPSNGESRISVFTNQLRLTIDSWNARPESWQVSLDTKSRGLLINRQWHYMVQNALADDPMIRREKNSGGESYFVLENRCVIRLKYLNRNLMSMNYPTRRSRHWNRQLKMPGLPPWDRLEFGYRLDITGTTIENAFVLLRQEENFLWVWQVMGERIDTFHAQWPLLLQEEDAEPAELFAYSDYGV